MTYRVLAFLLFTLLSSTALASHIVGGEVTYKCLGGNIYQITMFIYRDCISGQPSALATDNPAYFGIYRENGTLYIADSVYATKVDINSGLPSPFGKDEFFVPTNFSNSCINNPPAVCNSRLRFDITVNLPNNGQSYYFVYQRCCRNNVISSIINPGNTGATYFCQIPTNGSVTCNNSAVFNNFPPLIICANNPFTYDHSAFDIDGDSLSYELCDAKKGGSPNDPNPYPPDAPPYDIVNYQFPYSPTNPIGGNPPITIDNKTGTISGTPNMQGRYILTVCCHEWRNGVAINTIRREFQFVVTNCSKAVVADIPVLSPEEPLVNGLAVYNTFCKGYTVNFANKSVGGFDYFWDFGVSALNDDTSTQFQPTYTYPDTGTYVVSLFVNRSSTCSDSIQRVVKVYPEFKADFNFIGKLCVDSIFSFVDLSSSTYPSVNKWRWSVNGRQFSTLPNPAKTFDTSGSYQIRLISGNSFGCKDTVSKNINITPVNLFAGYDTSVMVNNYATLHGSGASQYLWTPSTFLNDPTLQYPTGFFTSIGVYPYILTGTTNNGCVVHDTIKVTVTTGPQFIVPNAFSPNGDGVNDYLRIIMSGYKKLNYFKIFDRWGRRVFYTTDFREMWDGTAHGADCDLGVYFWMAEGIGVDNKVITVKGDITLVK